MNGNKEKYYYFISLISLIILSWAIADLLRIYFAEQYPVSLPSYYSYRNNSNMDVAYRLSAIIIALPVFIFHWLKTSGGILKSRLNEFSFSQLQERKSYLQNVMIIFFLAFMALTIGIVYIIINALLLSQEIRLNDLTLPIPYSLTAFIVWAYHYSSLKDCGRRLQKLPQSEVMASNNEKAAFCGYCGAKNQEDFKYCTGCGKPL